VIASGQLPAPHDSTQVVGAKIFGYAFEMDDILTGATGSLFELQAVIHFTTKECDIVIKSDCGNPQTIQKFWEFIQRIILNL
jgi:hypothetical protein